MTLDIAKAQITSIKSNFDGRMMYHFEQLQTNKYHLKMIDSVSGIVRYITFEIKNGRNRYIDIDFVCEGFRINFPLKKDIDKFTFNLNDFKLMLEHGIKVDKNCLDPQLDLNVEF